MKSHLTCILVLNASFKGNLCMHDTGNNGDMVQDGSIWMVKMINAALLVYVINVQMDLRRACQDESSWLKLSSWINNDLDTGVSQLVQCTSTEKDLWGLWLTRLSLSLLTPNNRTMATKTQRNEIPIRTKAMDITRTLVYLTLDCRPKVHHAHRQLWKTNPSRTHKSCRGQILFFSWKILSTKEGWP